MKKFLLFAAAAIVAVSADAQLSKKQKPGKLQTRQQVEQKASFKKYEVAGAKVGVKSVIDKTTRMFKGSVKVSDVKPVARHFRAARAAEVQPMYSGYGKLRSTSEAAEWEMVSGTVTPDEGPEINVLQNVIPNIFGFEEGVLVEYSVSDGNIVIQPQLVASFPSDAAPEGTYYLFLEDAKSNDGVITMKMNENGGISGKYDIIYSVYPHSTYNINEWIATYDGIAGAQYTLPGEEVAPEVSFEPGNLVLFFGLGLNGYSYTYNLAMTGAYGTTNFINRTTDKATDWYWTAIDETLEEPSVYDSGSDRDFSLELTDGVIGNVQLIGANQTQESDPFVFGTGKYLEDSGAPHYTDCYIYAGQFNGSFILNDETPSIVTRQDPDGDLTFYTNWGTPDIYTSTSISKIYCYHEKPASPLYIEGITLPMVSFADNGNFNLHIKIVKCTYEGSKLQLGEVIAEGNATSENINADFNVGLTSVEIPLYTEDEFGMSTDLDYLFLDDEFVIIIEGWDNGTFSGILGSQDAPTNNARTSTWFERTGEEGSMRYYTNWPTSLFVGFIEAAYGYLHTSDDTNLVFSADGGEASIHVEPMLYHTDSETGEPATSIWLADDSDDIPDWLEVQYTNPTSSSDISFDLLFSVQPSDENRSVTLKFMQTGAILEVTVSQGGGAGINTVVTKIDNNAPTYNVAGQRVNNGYKGLVVKDGRKFMNK